MSIASEISRLQNSKADVKTIVNKDKDLINSGTAFIDDETLDNYDNKIEEMQEAYKKFIPIQTASGTEITLDNSNNDKVLVNISLEGNTEQTTFNGKNLFNKSLTPTNTSNTTYTELSTGVRATLGYVATNRYMTIPIPNPDNLLGKTLTLYSVMTPNSTNTPTVRLFWSNNNIETTKIGNNLTATGSIQWTIDSSYPSNCNGLALVFSSNATGTNAQVGDYIDYTNVQLEVGSSATSYEPYVGGIASPNPNYQQEVKTVTGGNTIDIVGRNLLDESTLAQGSFMNVGQLDRLYYYSNYYLVAGTYTLLTNLSSPFRYAINVASGTFPRATIDIANPGWSTSEHLTFTINQNGYFGLGISRNDGSNIVPSDISSYHFMLYQGSYDSSITYEPYQSQSYTIDLDDLELCKIGNYQDYLYKLNGTWYKHKEIDKLILNGSQNISLVTTGTNYTRFNVTVTGVILGTTSTYTLIRSDYYISKYAIEPGNIFISSTQNIVGLIHNSVITLADYKTWLGTSLPSIYYVLATPTEEEITDETLISQLEAVKLLSGTQNNFTIDADTLPTLNLNYIGEANPHL